MNPTGGRPATRTSRGGSDRSVTALSTTRSMPRSAKRTDASRSMAARSGSSGAVACRIGSFSGDAVVMPP